MGIHSLTHGLGETYLVNDMFISFLLKNGDMLSSLVLNHTLQMYIYDYHVNTMNTSLCIIV